MPINMAPLLARNKDQKMTQWTILKMALHDEMTGNMRDNLLEK